MQIRNLEVNILYHLCNPLNGREADGTATDKDLMNEFSDIPEKIVQSTIDTMIADELIRRNSSKPHLTITAKGIRQLQSSVVYRMQNLGCLLSDNN